MAMGIVIRLIMMGMGMGIKPMGMGIAYISPGIRQCQQPSVSADYALTEQNLALNGLYSELKSVKN